MHHEVYTHDTQLTPTSWLKMPGRSSVNAIEGNEGKREWKGGREGGREEGRDKEIEKGLGVREQKQERKEKRKNGSKGKDEQ